MSNNEKLLKQLSLIDTIISEYEPSNFANYSRLLGFERTLDLHMLSESDDSETSYYRTSCDILNILSRRYMDNVNNFFYTKNKNSSIYTESKNTFDPESLVSDEYKKIVLDIIEKGSSKLSYRSEIKNFECLVKMLNKDKEYFYEMSHGGYYYEMKDISHFAFFTEEHIVDRFSKIKRGDGFMNKRYDELCRSIPFCLFSEKIAYLASDNLSKKFSEMFIDSVRDKSARLRNILSYVEKAEISAGNSETLFSKEYKDYLEQSKANLKTFALFALSKKTSSFYAMQNLIVDLLHMDKSFALDIVCKTSLLNYQVRELLRKSMVN